jgi:hypothetical protein
MVLKGRYFMQKMEKERKSVLERLCERGGKSGREREE